MEKLEILHKTESNRKWHKEHDDLRTRFDKYLIKIENEVKKIE